MTGFVRDCCCYTRLPVLYKSYRCCTKHPPLYKTPAAVQNTRCCTKHPLLYKTPAAIQNSRCYTKHSLLYKTLAAVQNSRSCTKPLAGSTEIRDVCGTRPLVLPFQFGAKNGMDESAWFLEIFALVFYVREFLSNVVLAHAALDGHTRDTGLSGHAFKAHVRHRVHTLHVIFCLLTPGS